MDKLITAILNGALYSAERHLHRTTIGGDCLIAGFALLLVVALIVYCVPPRWISRGISRAKRKRARKDPPAAKPAHRRSRRT